MNAKAKRNMERPRERCIRPLPDGRFLVRWKYRGRQRQQIFDTITAARAKRDSVRVLIREGRYSSNPSPKHVSFIAAAQRFLDWSRANLRPATVREDERYVSRWLVSELFKGRALDEISAGDIELYKQQLGQRLNGALGVEDDRRLSRRAIDIEVGRIKRMFRLALEWELIEKNPAAKVKLHHVDNARKRFLSADEEKRLLAGCAESLRAVILFAINTGLRKGELIKLCWRDVDFELGQLSITAERTKGKRTRHIPLNPTALALLVDQKLPRTPDDPVFPNKAGRPMENLHHQFRRAALAAGLKDVSLHTLRHTFASRIVMATGSLVEARELLGHKDYQVTLRYAHLADAHLRAAVKKIG